MERKSTWKRKRKHEEEAEEEEEEEEDGEEEEEEAVDPEEEEEEGSVDPVYEHRYSSMYYKNCDAWAVRRKFGDKKQIWQISGKSYGRGKDEVKVWVDEAIFRLEREGMSETDAKEYVWNKIIELD